MIATFLTAMLLLLTACGNSASTPPDSPASQPADSSVTQGKTETVQPEDGDTAPETTEPDHHENSSTTESNILVVYFSRVGVTPFDDDVDATSSASINIRDGELVGNMQYLTEFIAEETSGDLFQIITEKEYPTDYRDTTDLAKDEQNNDGRPALASHVEDMSQYDVIFLGHPIWYGDMPMAVYTFLESYDWTGKTIIPFSAHAGSGLAGTENRIASVCSGATAQSNRDSARKSVTEWLGNKETSNG